LFKVFPTGLEREGYELDRMIKFAREPGAAGVPLSRFTNEFKNVDAGLRFKRLGTLLEGKDLYRFSRTTLGRTAQILVHKDYLEAYKKEHPADTEKPWETR
jgi:hypothetical protein